LQPGYTSRTLALFDFGFFEFDVLARNRVVFLEYELLGLIARVLFGHVIVARPGCTYELDLLGDRLGHVILNKAVDNLGGP
jgi:hypothetical protein